MTYEVNVKNLEIKQHYEAHFDDGRISKKLEFNKEVIDGQGFFEKPFLKPSNADEEILDAISFADVDIYPIDEDNNERNYNLVAHISSFDRDDEKFNTLNLSFYFDRQTIAAIKSIVTDNELALSIRFEIDEWIDAYTGKGRVTLLDNSRCKSTNKAAIDYQIIDIKNYLIRQNCAGSRYGQVSDICIEFANSFRNVPAGVNKGEILDSINSLLTSWRYTFHSKLDEKERSRIELLTEAYEFESTAIRGETGDELDKIKRRTDRDHAIRIYNMLWMSKSAETTLRNGFKISEDEAQSIADEYLKLKYVFSETCEKILLDILISCDISEYASVAQYHGLITQPTPFFIEAGMYKPEFVLNKNKGIKEAILQVVFDATFHLIGRVISGLISWWISGLIAGDNETAHFVLFGTMFAADTVLMGMYQTQKIKKDEKIAVSKEQHCYDIIKHMCNLHYHSYYMDTKLMRHILNQLASMGFKSQTEIFRIISLVESRK